MSRKVVGKSARGNPEKKYERMAQEAIQLAIDVCLRVLKESNKSEVRELQSRAHFFRQPFSK